MTEVTGVPDERADRRYSVCDPSKPKPLNVENRWDQPPVVGSRFMCPVDVAVRGPLSFRAPPSHVQPATSLT
jgi:hypothetical protein